jgi:hypothetical protein
MSMLLDTIADPGPLEAGKVYRLDLPALRHTRLHDSFVPGIATLPACRQPASDRLRAERTAARRADRRALAGGPDAAEAGRTDRARIRRLRSAKDV